MEETQNNEFKGKIKPGEVRNPGGRPHLPDDVRDARRAKREDFWRHFCNAADLNANELASICESESAKTWQVTAARMVKRFKEGQISSMKFVSEQLFGKAVEPVAFVSANLNTADAKDLDAFLNKCVSGEVVPTREQLYALKLALQKQGAIPDAFGEFQFVTQDQLKEPPKNV